MTVNLSSLAGAAAQFFDDNGVILSGGLIYTYVAGTTTPATTYTSLTGLVAQPNPIVLNAAGRVPTGEIWLNDDSTYKFIVKTSLGVQIGSYDNVPGINDFPPIYADLSNTSNPTLGDALVGFRQSNSSGNLANSVGRTVHQKLQELISVKDFGAVGDGLTNDLTAIQNAIAALSGGGTLYFPAGNYFVTGKIEITANGVSILGDGRGATTITTNALTGDIIAVGSSISITRSNTISNLTINSVVARTDGASIHVAGAKATTIDNVEIRNGFDGIRVTSYGNQAQTVINNVLIENSTFFGIGMVFGETNNVCNEVFITQVTIADCWYGVKFFLCSGFYSSNVSIYTSRNVGVAMEPNAGQSIYGLQLSNWISDSSAVDGWLIGGLGKTAEVFLNNCYASSNGQNGFHLFVGVVLNTISLNDCIAKRNGRIGMLINNGVNININGAFCSNNSISAINVYDGLVIGPTARRIFINGGYFGLGTFDEAFGNINYQRYGLGVEAGADYYSVIGTNAFDNQTGGFNNLTDNGTTKIAQINTSF